MNAARVRRGGTLRSVNWHSTPYGLLNAISTGVDADRAGFVLEAKSEVNANPADTRDHPNGVWTLPPTNRHDAADSPKYAAIGESDRMTLRFRKPAR